MSTVIYPSPIFGPIKSRRLGVSLGINLLPGDGKVCTFDCIYCECGFNADRRPTQKFPTRNQVAEALEQKLLQMKTEGIAPDVLTFAGNGEPTAHPDFAAIIDDTLLLRDRHFPQAKVSVLTNATRIILPEVDGSGSPVDVEIQGRCGDACQRILVIPQQIQRVLIVDGGNADGLSNVVSSEVGCITQTFAAGFRHPSGDQFGTVHIVRQTVRNEDKLTVRGVLPEKFRIP